MNKYLSSSLNSVVSLDLETSWAAKSLQEAIYHAKYGYVSQFIRFNLNYSVVKVK